MAGGIILVVHKNTVQDSMIDLMHDSIVESHKPIGHKHKVN
jgi:hypothetical protein